MFKSIKHKLTCLLLLTGILAFPFQVSAITVLVQTSLGNFEIELFEHEAPATVDNFLKYIEDGTFADSFIHRSVAGFVIQGGQFTYTNNILGEVPEKTTILNEFRRSNTRGTIAMAKLSGNPDSATSSWFINLADNGSLDSENGGYTVFGEVRGNGMEVIDAIASQPVYNAGSAFGSLPLVNYSGSGTILSENLVITNFSIPNASNNYSDLQVTKTVDIRSPALGNSVQFQVKVTNAGPDAAPSVVLQDLLPTGMQIPGSMSAFSTHGSYNAQSGAWSIGTLNSGVQATLNIPAVPRQYVLPECYVNQASIPSYTGYDPQRGNNAASAIVSVGGVSTCSKLTVKVTPSVFEPTTCVAGSSPDLLVFDVRVHNAGPDAAVNATVSLNGNIGGDAQSAQNGLSFAEIASGQTVSGSMTWNLACTRNEVVAAYEIVATSESTASTDSITTVSGQYTVASSVSAATTTTDTTTDDGDGGGCFIATAAYGSYMDPHVYALRQFRDEILMQTGLGRQFVSLYYEYSPRLANIISGNETLRLLTRWLLTPLVYTVAYPMLALLILCIAGWGLYYRRTRVIRHPF
jgi:peptidyl-prolyl cis-trans isomerase A (cyclophilin A)